ncbi:hypothetical protein Aperf_G00000094275 [Anoplocephala perfoliata]
MNPSTTHNSNDMKGPSPYSIVPTSAPPAGAAHNTTELMTIGGAGQQPRPPSYAGTSSSATSSFTPLVNVDATTLGANSADFTDYFNAPSSAAAAVAVFNNSHHAVPSTYASLISENDPYGARTPMATAQLPASHIPFMSTSRFIGGLTSKLPDLQCAAAPPGPMEMAYSAPHMVGALASSPHASLISPAYSPSSVTTQGSGGGGGGGGSSKRSVLDVDSKPGAFKARSKKESHNRIERRRRDYINSQITRLSSLLPPDMYRDVDGRRNKGTVLRLSVNYILDLRSALAQTTGVRHELSLARQLIPLLLNYIQSLENVLKEAEAAADKTLVGAGTSSTDILDEGPAVYDGVLEAWRAAMRANMTRPVMTTPSTNTGGENAPPQQESKMETAEMPLENMQMAFAAGRPPTTSSGSNPVVSSYHPNAIFVGAPICKQEESEDICYGGGPGGDLTTAGAHMLPPGVTHVPDDTTDGFFDAGNGNNNNSSTSGSVSKFDLSVMQLASANGPDCGDPMQTSIGKFVLLLSRLVWLEAVGRTCTALALKWSVRIIEMEDRAHEYAVVMMLEIA